MLYFTPETSKKLEEMGLQPSPDGTDVRKGFEAGIDVPIVTYNYHTLDICEIENAKKLWGELDGFIDPDCEHCKNAEYGTVYELKKYITLSDEERIKYVEDYLSKK